MGLFGRREKDSELATLTEAEGFCGIAAVAVYSDGVLNAEEDDRLMETLLSLDVMADADEDEVREALAKLSSLAQRHGDARVLQQSVEAIPVDRREDAFRLAAEIIVADGEVDEEERAFIDRFRHALGLDHATARRLVEELA